MEPGWINTFNSRLDAVRHVMAAFDNGMTQMWTRYTGNDVATREWATLTPDIQQDPAGDDECEALLLGFSDFLNQNNYRSGNFNRVFVLISANTAMVAVCNGAAWTATDQNNNPVPGRLATWPDNINFGGNSGSYRGRTEPSHLGKLIAQEVGHNWGEPDHPCQKVANEYSVMAGSICGAPWDSRKYWLHYADPAKNANTPDSRQRVISGTLDYDT
jgi:hypothetical protein